MADDLYYGSPAFFNENATFYSDVTVLGSINLSTISVDSANYNSIVVANSTTLNQLSGLSTALVVNGNALVTGIVTASLLSLNQPSGVSTALMVNGNARVTGITTLGSSNGIGTVTIGIGTTALLVSGNTRITGTLAIGTSSIVLDGNANTISGVTSITDSSGGYLSHPPGTIIFHSASTAPSGYIKANGAIISRSAYSALFNTLGTTYGAGDGSTTFQIPDMRGQFPRGFDDGAGVDSGRTFGTSQSDAIVSHSHPISVPTVGSSGGDDASVPRWSAKTSIVYAAPTANTSNNSGSTETRPKNIALLACIKY